MAAVAGLAIIIDKTTGEPSVQGKSSTVLETKLIKEGQVDVIEKNNEVYFLKGIG
jgi:hypothetical protein